MFQQHGIQSGLGISFLAFYSGMLMVQEMRDLCLLGLILFCYLAPYQKVIEKVGVAANGPE